VSVVLAIGPYIVSRVRSAGRQIRVRSGMAKSEVSANPVTHIRVLSFNIAHGRGATDDNWEGAIAEKRKRIDDIAQLIAKADADVVVLNEVDFSSTWSGHQNQAEAIALAAGFPYWVEQRNLDFRFVYGSWKFGNAVLSRFPIVDAEAMEFPALRSSERVLAGCKQGVVCTLQLSQSQQIGILAVHLEHRSEDTRVLSAKLIIKAVEASKMPLVVLGDFNSTPSSFPHSQSSADGQNAMDLLIESSRFDLNVQKLPTQQEMTYSSTLPTRVIDWILIPKNWQFTDYRLISSRLSDHLPVVADLQLPMEEDE
jgi:endonuclease/exonuclease/phosphatase family metal-dependent hydrolase